MNFSILYPPTIDYDWLVQRPQQLMRCFAKLGATVYYMNPGSHSRYAVGITSVSPDLHVVNKTAPPLSYDLPLVYYFSAAEHIGAAGNYSPSLVVFDYLDEPVEEFAYWHQFKAQALAGADLVVAASDSLYREACLASSNVILAPNGCDASLFAPAAERALPVPEDIAGIAGPIIGYHGAVATWLDYGLICQIADAYPDWNLVFVGPFYNVSDVPRRPNLHWLGYKELSQLPAYDQMFDVAIIPFRISALTQAVNPIKMWEYLASGLPVVSTALAETKNRADIYYSEDPQAFLANIARALHENNETKKQARVALAAENDWLKRAQVIMEAIRRTYAARSRHIIRQQLHESQDKPQPREVMNPGRQHPIIRVRKTVLPARRFSS